MQVLSSNGCEALEFQIGSLMSTDLVTINRHAPLNAAIERMADIGTHHLLVGDQDEFVGLISSLDIVREKALDSRSFPWIRK
ncbi:MAG: CBS domain-containing protein [Candidatus Kariarchaeaceae archaeon]|jgi:CBS domain-containing protein